jgi:proline iminopeptidase
MAIPAPTSSGYTTTTDVPLYWATWGTPGNPRLLVLHGGPGAHHDYLLPQMLQLAERNELVFYDQRGGGKSRTDERAPIGWQTHVADLATVVSELGFDPLTIVGYSWGGLLALLYAIDPPVAGAPASNQGPPDQPRSSPPRRGALPPARLVLIDPAPVTRQYRTRFEAEFRRRQEGPEIQELRRELAESGLRESDPPAFRQRTFELGVAGYFADPSAATQLTPFRVTGRVQQSVWESLGDYDLCPDLTALEIPALVVHGREDPIPLDSSVAVAEALAARLVVLDNCGHVPYVEQPAALFAAINRFLDDTDSSVGG